MAYPVQESPASERPAQERITGAVKALMAAHGEDQDDLGEVLHMSQSSVSKMLRGVRKMTVDELDTLAVHYGVDPTTFFAGVEAAFRPRPPDPSGGGNTRYRNGLVLLPGGGELDEFEAGRPMVEPPAALVS